jgi:ABC-type uncharacterized transport system auxiliary subunit
MTRLEKITALIIALSGLCGCALLSKGNALDVHYYTPVRAQAPAAQTAADLRAAEAGPPGNSGPALRVGRVEAGVDLGQRIVYGDGVFRVSYYEDRRWNERPDLYVRDALNQVLFEERGFQRVVSGAATSLDVRIQTFQEVQTAERHAVRIVLGIALAKDRVFFENTVDVTEDVRGPAFEDVVSAMSRALYEAADQVAQRVGTALATVSVQ